MEQKEKGRPLMVKRKLDKSSAELTTDS